MIVGLAAISRSPDRRHTATATAGPWMHLPAQATR